jgi:unsaturated rhamnogalacturonyl hydrolase
VENKIPLGLYGWGRGLGWFAIGLIDTWTELPVNSEHRNELEKIVVNYAKAITTFQQENGSWNWTVGRNECRADSSTTATLGWFMLNASRISEISNECLASTDKAIKYLMKVTRRNGAVDFSQGDTKDIGVYSMSFNVLPFTQGFCIRTINLYENQKLVKSNVEKVGNF